MMTHYIPALIASFPWLTESEAANVAQLLDDVDPTGSAADQITGLAEVLDKAGLPPTSTLLLKLAGRGSKKTAVAAARTSARARFERARDQTPRAYDLAAPASTALAVNAAPATGMEAAQVRELVQDTVECVLAAMPGAFASGAGDDRVLKLIEGLSHEVHWLRSTIDTERQLRRYREMHGPLPEHQVSQGPATTAERRDVVQQLAHSLERQRFGTQVDAQAGYRIDSADGAQE
jgi:hypothetical protein